MFMKIQIFSLTLFLAAWTLISASPLPPELLASLSAQARIIRYDNENDGSGNYKFSFETSDGTKRDETGTLVNAGQPNAHVIVMGSYTYRRPDGQSEVVSYTSDENGFVVVNAPLIQEELPPINADRIGAAPPLVIATLLG